MKIVICSSIDFTPKMAELKNHLESARNQVTIPYYSELILNGTVSYEEYMSTKQENGGDIVLRDALADTDFFIRYWNAIKECDVILVLNEEKKGIKGYIGGNTLIEMGYAYGFGKKIYLYNPIPERSVAMHYVDEIIDMKPEVINGDLSKIS